MDLLQQFISKIQNDASIDAHHIAIYTSLYFLWLNRKDEWLEVDKETVMRFAKISSKATYYRKISLLGERSYIGYQPSQANGVPTRIKMITAL